MVFKFYNLPVELQKRLQIQTMRKSTNLKLIQLGLDEKIDHIPLEQLWDEAYNEDLFQIKIPTLLRTGIKHSQKICLADCTEVGGKLFFRSRKYVPEHALLRTCLIREGHDWLDLGHFGGANIYALLFRHY